MFYVTTDLLTPWSRVLLEKLTGFQLVKNFPALYGTRKFITAYTNARHLSLSWASSIQSMPPHPTSWRSSLILSSHLSPVLPSGFFPSGFPTKTLYTPILAPIRATCPAHLILFDSITRAIMGGEYTSLSYSLCNFHHSSVPSTLLVPNIPLNTLFSENLILSSSLNVSELQQHKIRKPATIVNQINLIKIQSPLPKKYKDRNLQIIKNRLLGIGAVITVLTIIQWWRDVTREGIYQGLHTKIVTKELRWGIILFIA